MEKAKTKKAKRGTRAACWAVQSLMWGAAAVLLICEPTMEHGWEACVGLFCLTKGASLAVGYAAYLLLRRWTAAGLMPPMKELSEDED